MLGVGGDGGEEDCMEEVGEHSHSTVCKDSLLAQLHALLLL